MKKSMTVPHEDDERDEVTRENTEPTGRIQDLEGKKRLRSQVAGLRWGMKKPRTVPHEDYFTNQACMKGVVQQ